MRNDRQSNDLELKEPPSVDASDGKGNGEHSASDLPAGQKTISRGDSYTVSDAELLDYYFDSLAYSRL